MIRSFSKKQRVVLSWWQKDSKHENKQAILCDGSIRSGKTFALTLSFFLWAMNSFSEHSFALCGKTRGSVERNVLEGILPLLNSAGFLIVQNRSNHFVEVSLGNRKNRFYIFGGKDEGSSAYIQGMTLAGALFDEVVLLPRSFVEQAIARCSVPNSRLWMSCNPAYPGHWFYEEWVQKVDEKRVLYLPFTMDDNPSLSESIKNRYKTLYSGVFYQRFVEGKWVAAEGCVYDRFKASTHVVRQLPMSFSKYHISCDYGTVNPTSFGLWGESAGIWYRIKESYFDSKKEGFKKTDQEHFEELLQLAEGLPIESIVIDPSAASFIEWIRRDGRFVVKPADNRVLYGIQQVSEALAEKQILFSSTCANTIREFALYRWAEGKETVIKENDHAMDDIRYFVTTILNEKPEVDDFFVGAISRK